VNLLHTLKGRFSDARFAPYEAVTRDDAGLTLALYEWNMRTAAAFFEDLGAFEVLLRNSIDIRLRAKYCPTATALPWYRQVSFNDKAKAKVDIAVERATLKGTVPEDPDVVVAELNFGFWRYTVSKYYSGTIWPFIQNAFQPESPGPKLDRRTVDGKVDGLYYLRNRVAHHQPIFQRDLERDRRTLLGVAGWMCPDTRDWIASRSQVPAALAARPVLPTT
jgi:hypothetical protein